MPKASLQLIPTNKLQTRLNIPLVGGAVGVVVPGVFEYKRPGGIDLYRRPGGVDLYKRPA